MFKQKQIKKVMKLLKEKGYEISKSIDRRVRRYEYEKSTEIRLEEDKVIITTEIKIKGVYNTLIIHPDGTSKLEFNIIQTNFQID